MPCRSIAASFAGKESDIKSKNRIFWRDEAARIGVAMGSRWAWPSSLGNPLGTCSNLLGKLGFLFRVGVDAGFGLVEAVDESV